MVNSDTIVKLANSSKGSALFAEYVKVFLKKNYPGHVNDKSYQQMAASLVVQQLSSLNVPKGIDETLFVTKCLEAAINDLKGV